MRSASHRRFSVPVTDSLHSTGPRTLARLCVQQSHPI